MLKLSSRGAGQRLVTYHCTIFHNQDPKAVGPFYHMKTALLFLGLLGGPGLSGWLGSGSPVAAGRVVPAATVYVCMSQGSVAYHDSDGCLGLNRCTHTIKTMSEAQARELGKRACRKCY